MIQIATSTCAYCGLRIVADLDGDSTLDWGAEGDYGCELHPLNGRSYVYSHQPSERAAVALHLAASGMFNTGLRGEKYVDETMARSIQRANTPEYRAAYNLGWRYSQRESATLDHIDSQYSRDSRYDAILDGYLDLAAGRAKWHRLNCPDHDHCGE